MRPDYVIVLVVILFNVCLARWCEAARLPRALPIIYQLSLADVKSSRVLQKSHMAAVSLMLQRILVRSLADLMTVFAET